MFVGLDLSPNSLQVSDLGIKTHFLPGGEIQRRNEVERARAQCPRVHVLQRWKGAQHEEEEKGEGPGRRGKTLPGSTLALAPGCALTFKSLPWNEQISFLLEVPLRAVIFKAEIEWQPQFVGEHMNYISLGEPLAAVTNLDWVMAQTQWTFVSSSCPPELLPPPGPVAFDTTRLEVCIRPRMGSS